MFSPLSDPHVDEWFQRFSGALKRLPAAERADLHQEVRQHLESLVAANEELGSSPQEAWQLAMAQFGDPAKIGWRLRREALALPRDPNQWAANPRTAAGIYSFVLCTGSLALLAVVTFVFASAALVLAPGMAVSSPVSIGARDAYYAGLLLAPIAAGWMTGKRVRCRALEGTFLGLSTFAGSSFLLSLITSEFAFCALVLVWLGLGCFSAWVAGRIRGRKLLPHELA